MVKQNNKLFLQCKCSCSILTIEKDKIDKNYYIGLFKDQFGWKLNLLERLRWAKEILFKGNIWTDEIILEQNEINKLKKFINHESK